ncbi:MAG: hypothetical protein ACRYFA_04965 [Janthinobacterium lividum]
MKKLYFPLLMLLLSAFSSCVNVEERYTFLKDGACKIDYRFNMGKAVSVLSNLLPDSVKQTPSYLIQKDTAINFYSDLTEAERKKLSKDEINLARATLLHLKMNLKNNQMLVNVQYEAKGSKEVKYFLTHFSDIAQQQKIGQLISDPRLMQAGASSGGMGINAAYFDYDIGSKHFYRKVDTVKFRKYFKQNEAMYNMAKAALIDMPYSMMIRFPRPIKKTGNIRAKLSSDKKQLTLNSTMDEIVKTPQLLNLKVEY